MFSYFVVAFALIVCATAELVIQEAGRNGKEGPVITQGLSFCPNTFSTAGFSVECRGVTGPVKFKVNGNDVRTEGVAPYMIAGDINGDIYKWTSYPAGDLTVACEAASGTETVSFAIQCGTSSTGPTVTPPTTPSVTAAPPSAPSTAPAPSMSPSKPASTSSKTACVRLTGAMNNGLATDWELDGTSVWYRKGSNFGGVVPGGTADISFSFTAPVSGTYLITADMTTDDPTDFNDFWLRFPSVGLTLKRLRAGGVASIFQRTGAQYVKAYHNSAGRATAAWSVDNDPHAISTGTPLVEGQQYTIIAGARSANLQIHNIILFPCEGNECVPYSSVFTNGVSRCKSRAPGSSS